LLENNEAIARYFTKQELEGLFKLDIFSKNVEYIYKRVFPDN